MFLVGGRVKSHPCTAWQRGWREAGRCLEYLEKKISGWHAPCQPLWWGIFYICVFSTVTVQCSTVEGNFLLVAPLTHCQVQLLWSCDVKCPQRWNLLVSLLFRCSPYSTYPVLPPTLNSCMNSLWSPSNWLLERAGQGLPGAWQAGLPLAILAGQAGLPLAILAGFARIFLDWLQLSGLSWKSPKNVGFWLKSLLKLELWQIKSNFFSKLSVFSEHPITSCIHFSFGKHNKNSFVGNNQAYFLT